MVDDGGEDDDDDDDVVRKTFSPSHHFIVFISFVFLFIFSPQMAQC